MPRPAPPRADRRYWLLFALCCAALCTPVLATTYQPLVDYPNHLARIFILGHYHDTPAFAAAFERDLTLVPNLGVELLATPLLRVLPLGAASRIVLCLTLVLFAAGCHVLTTAAQRRRSPLALVLALTAWHSAMLYGFVNNALGVGVFLLVLAAWLRMRERWTAGRLLAVSLGIALGFVVHMSTLAFFTLAVVAITACDVATRRRLSWQPVLDLLPLVPAAVLFVLFHPRAAPGAPGTTLRWNTAANKLIALGGLLRGYDAWLDAATIAALAIVLVAAVRLRSSVQVRWPFAAAAAAMFVALAVMPRQLFTSYDVDTRFAVPGLVLAALAVRIALPARTASTLAATAAALLLVRLASIAMVFGDYDRRVRELVPLLDRLPPGARVLSDFHLVGATADERKRNAAFEHVVHWATIRRAAIVSSIFARRTVQPLHWREPAPAVPQFYLTPANATRVLADWEWVWTVNAPPATDSLLRRVAERRAASGAFALWELRRAAP